MDENDVCVCLWGLEEIGPIINLATISLWKGFGL